MTEFKLSVSGKDGKAYKKQLSGSDADALIGKKLGETISGDMLGLPGYELKITGGSDKDGFPMRPGFHGSRVVELLLAEGPGFRPATKGARRKKRVRGDTVSESICQINFKVTKQGGKTLRVLLGGDQGAAEKSRDEVLEEKKRQIQEALLKVGEATAAEAKKKAAGGG
ncbi:MAG: 30S ribosomal protein S6e [archaeon]